MVQSNFCKVACVLLVAAAVCHGGFAGLARPVKTAKDSHAMPVNVIIVAEDKHHPEPYAYPKYNFEYGVKDGHTGDYKSQSEHRDGDSVKGSYTLLEPNGHTRTVHYSADKHSGFTAHVFRDGHPVLPPVAAPLHQPTAYVASVGYGHGYSKVDHGSH